MPSKRALNCLVVPLLAGTLCGLALAAAAQARVFEMGGDGDNPYSIMAPERIPPAHHGRPSRKHAAQKRPARPARAGAIVKHPGGHGSRKELSVVRGSSASVLLTPLPRTGLIAPEGGGRLTVAPLRSEQGPSIVPGVANPVPNLPHGAETFQDRASRCAFQSGLYNVPGTAQGQYIGGCVQ